MHGGQATIDYALLSPRLNLPALAMTDAHAVILNQDVHFTTERGNLITCYDPMAIVDRLRRSLGALRSVDTDTLMTDSAEQRERMARQGVRRKAWHTRRI